MSQALRKLTGGVSRSKCVLIFINQIREKIGVMFGSPETTPGGRALKFYSSCRIDVRRIGPVKDGEEIVGSRIKAKIVKNKVAPPFRVCEFDMMYTHGISREADLLDLAIVDKLVEKSGSWFNYGDLRLGQGRENVKLYLHDNPALANELAHRQPLGLRRCREQQWCGRRGERGMTKNRGAASQPNSWAARMD
jgi:recombination protein RecA